ncbi:MAG: DUF2279 domain-containing protein [Calditrichaeota bacterium]|nr:MAG: DUF2279 domain-containing protein [Calditrichota bacterium]
MFFLRPLFIWIILFLSGFFAVSLADDSEKSAGQFSIKQLKPAYYLIDDGTPIRMFNQIKPVRFYGFLGAVVVFDLYSLNRLRETWYSQPIGSFHFIEFEPDWRARKQTDKLAHMMDAYFATHLASKAYRWSGFSTKNSIWYGALTGWVWMLQIEIIDAFFQEWGFSVLDLTFNTFGVSYATLQQLYPDRLSGIRLKASYHTSDAYRNNLYSETNKSRIDDYEGMTWWLTLNIHDVMPEGVQKDYPGWLKPWGIAVGQRVENIARNIYGGERHVYIGLDFDITKIPTGDSKTLKFVKNILNFVRLPLPAVRVSDGTVWYGIYF